MNAFLYLELHLLKNRFISTLKSPKQVLPYLIIGSIGAFPLLMLYTLGFSPVEPPFTALSIKPTLFSFMAVTMWILVFYSVTGNALVFSLPEIDFLFPSPVGRRTILLNRIISEYGGYAALAFLVIGFLLWVLSLAFVFSVWHRLIFLWMAVTLLMVCAFNVGWLIVLLGSNLSELKYSRLKIVVIGICLVIVGIFLLAVHQKTAAGAELTDAALSVLNSTVMRVAMAPATLAADMAVTWKVSFSVAAKILGLLLVDFVTLGAVLSVKSHFYEASEAISRKRWMLRKKVYAKEVVVSESFARRMFKIHPFGVGSTALVWKNLASALRDIRNLAAVGALAAFYFIYSYILGESSMFFAIPLALIAANNLRWDLREDIRRIEIIKLVPESNWRIILSEIAVPSVLAMAVSYTFLIVSFLAFPIRGLEAELFWFSLAFLPLFCIITTALCNVAVLYYPPQTDSQMLSTVVGLILAGVVFTPLLVLIILVHGIYSILLALLAYGIVAFFFLKLLERKYRLFEIVSG
ncbi:MAG: putative ABC exporter domain-containing protein [Candidatus Methanofastidiosia archaeon]